MCVCECECEYDAPSVCFKTSIFPDRGSSSFRVMTSSSKIIANCFNIFCNRETLNFLLRELFALSFYCKADKKSNGCSLITACQSSKYCLAAMFLWPDEKPSRVPKLNNVSG